MRELMEGFDALKENFGESLHEELPLDLPAPLDSLTIPNVVNQGQMMISRYLPCYCTMTPLLMLL